MKTPTISAVIITLNEEAEITECLKSVRFCDEIIVLDGGSNDSTSCIAHQLGCKVFEDRDWLGFGIQKQRALDQASGDWILSIDADERITEVLAEEIIDGITSRNFDGFQIPRSSYYLGKLMRFGGWYPDYVLRVARRGVASFDPAPVHEKLLVNGRLGKLKNPIIHYSYRSVNEILTKQQRYAIASSEKKQLVSEQSGVFKAFFKSFWCFLKQYFFQFGALDGRRGFISAVSRSQETFWKYILISDLADRNKSAN